MVGKAYNRRQCFAKSCRRCAWPSDKRAIVAVGYGDMAIMARRVLCCHGEDNKGWHASWREPSRFSRVRRRRRRPHEGKVMCGGGGLEATKHPGGGRRVGRSGEWHARTAAQRRPVVVAMAPAPMHAETQARVQRQGPMDGLWSAAPRSLAACTPCHTRPGKRGLQQCISASVHRLLGGLRRLEDPKPPL
ncbi:hypothetical protein EJ04DRAFT_83904 [Polyplosphaeria fusca]|uniref:Uncharacterized protein n=1 Tax=Polyplosphaeria fusca TaxID=682080 RepID=A0A9P4QP84_9PLEO|nr:hypothetical protein EJ04DRAFT_83904 [Polyplosphaeria fusca]